MFDESEHDIYHHMDQRAHQSKTTNVLEAQARGKIEGTHQEASWTKAAASARTHWSADWWAQPPTSSFGQQIPGSFLKLVWGASPAATRARIRDGGLE